MCALLGLKPVQEALGILDWCDARGIGAEHVGLATMLLAVVMMALGS